MHNYLVGPIIKATPNGIFCPSSCFLRIQSIIGSINESVFPEPVYDRQSKSCPLLQFLSVYYWIRVGFSYPRRPKHAITDGCRSNPLKESDNGYIDDYCTSSFFYLFIFSLDSFSGSSENKAFFLKLKLIIINKMKK